MANENAAIDNNREHTLLGVTDSAAAEIRRLLVDAITGRLKVSATFTSITLSSKWRLIVVGENLQFQYWDGSNWIVKNEMTPN